MSDQAGNIVPFGKYKGQPLAAMMADRQYCEWLASQGWFAEKYQPIYQIVVMGAPEPQDTPAHNRLQALFLDDGFCERFVCECGFRREDAPLKSVSYDHGWREWRESKEILTQATGPLKFRREFEVGRAQIDVVLDVSYRQTGTAVKQDSRRSRFGEADVIKPGEVFEFDVVGDGEHYRIEIKPSLGDDFPTVLRQARAKGCNTVVFETFAATTVTLEQIRAMFAPIRLVSLGGIIET
jgi:hypothetical protein